jgi:hypothetical protein
MDMPASTTGPLPAAPPSSSNRLDDVEPETVRTDRAVLAEGRERQRERFGGAKFGAAFFGWLVSVGMTVLLSAVAAGAGAAIGSNLAIDAAGADAATVGLTGAATVLVVLALAYLTGGYVAGRLARFDGTRNGVLTWLVGMVMTVLAGLVAAAIGSNSDLVARVRLPAFPGDLATLTMGGLIALAVLLIVTLLAAAAGGRLGERFHRRVDRAAWKK